MKELILTILCIFGGTCLAQEVIVNVNLFSVEDGLSDRSIFSATQDDRGLMWIGTGNGINRFDGSEFKKIEDVNNQLSSGEVLGVRKDKFGNIWVQKEGEPVLLFDPYKEEVLPLLIKDSFENERLEILNFDTQGKNIFLKNEKGRLFHLNELEEIIPFGSIIYDSKKYLKPTAWNTILSKETGSNISEEIDGNGLVQRRFRTTVKRQDIWETEGNYLRMITTNNNLSEKKLSDVLWELNKSGSPKPIDLKKDGRSLFIKDLDLPHVKYLGLTKDSKGNMWLSINEKLWFFDSEGNLIKELSAELFELSGGISFKINHIFIDDHDRLWLSSGLGLFLVQVKENPFENYLTTNNKTSVRGIIEISGDRLLVNTYSGAKIIDKNTKQEFLAFNYTGLGFSKDNKGNIWQGNHAASVSFVREQDINSNTIHLNGCPIIDGQGIQESVPFFDETSGEMYSGSNNGLYFYNKECSCFEDYPKTNEFEEIAKKGIYAFHANEKAIWVATSNGLYQLDREKGIVNNFQFPYNTINHLHEDAVGDFWLATKGGGLIHWNRSEDVIKQYTVKDGLSHNVLYAVYEDSQNNLWLTSNKGLMRFKKTTAEIEVFQKEDGIPHEEFNTYSHYRGNDGKLYFGGLAGVTSFYPEQMIFEESHIPFLIIEIQKFNFKKGVLLNKTKEVQDQGELILNANDKFFNISFSLLDYARLDNINYAWKIEGLEEDWNHQTENSIRINALPYGNYNLLIKAKGEGGKWAKNQINIPITVLKPFYLSWQFIAFAIGLLSFLIYGFIKLRLLRLERTKEKLKGLVKERTAELYEKNKELEQLNTFKDKIYSIIAHDLRGPAFALQDIGKKIDYLLKSQQFERLQGFGETVDESITTLNTLLDNLLNWASQNMGAISLNPESLNVGDLLDQSIKELRLNIDKKDIVIETNIDPELNVFGDRQTILTISRNLLSNAVKFVPNKGAIKLKAKATSDSTTVIQIIDNGIGIEADRLAHIFDPKKSKSTSGSMGEKGTGLGLGVSKELALLNGGDIEVTSTIGKGSTFSVILPTHCV